jgi:hypothetical protein
MSVVTRAATKSKVRARNLALKNWRHYSKRLARRWKISRERLKNGSTVLFNLARAVGRRLLTVHKPLVRFRRRSRRRSEIARSHRHERAVERRALRAGRSGRPLLLGPWTSEVGFEVLYWIPFLRWLKGQCGWDPASAVAVSRGGVASWYQGLADAYVEIFDHVDPETFARRNEARTAVDGSRKQLGQSELDRDLIACGCTVAGLDAHTVVHPSLMYQLFRQFWLGRRPLTYVAERTRFELAAPPARFDLSMLPADYVAVKLYAARSLPDSARNREVIQRLVDRLTSWSNVVTLDTGFTADDHDDYHLDRRDRLFGLGPLMTAANNLELQTQVIGRARGFVGTCGALAWLAPMLGVPAVALFSDDSFLREHLYFARHTYTTMEAARFKTVDVSAFEDLGVDAVSDLARAALS